MEAVAVAGKTEDRWSYEEIFPLWEESLSPRLNLKQMVNKVGVLGVAEVILATSHKKAAELAYFFLLGCHSEVLAVSKHRIGHELLHLAFVFREAESASLMLRHIPGIPVNIKAELVSVIVESESPRLAFLTVYYNDKNPITGDDKARLLRVVFLAKEPKWAYCCCLAIAEKAKRDLWQIPSEDKKMFYSLGAVVTEGKDKKWVQLFFYRYVYGYSHYDAHLRAYSR